MADWDIVVIGGGAAGLAAAAVAAGSGTTCLVVDRMGAGGELMNLGALHDRAQPATGPGLAARLLDDAIAAGAGLVIAEVTALTREGPIWRVVTDDETHTARAVILAAGLAPGSLGLDNERDFAGRGLSHCAACDGPLFHGQPVAVAGADRWAQQEARDLAAIASAVTLVTQDGTAPAIENVTVLAGRVIALEGADGLETVLAQPDDGGAPRRIAAQAVFVQSGRRADLGFAPDALARAPDGAAIVSPGLECNLPCVFAAGDNRAGAARTLAAAMADGRRAASMARAAIDRTP